MRWLPLIAVAAFLPLPAIHAADAPKGKIVYSRKDGDKYLMHVMAPDGTGDQVLPGQTDAANIFPVWSPDGKKIAFMAGPKVEGEDFKVCVLNVDGTGLVTFTLPGKLNGLPAWSPDGKQMLVVAGDQEPDVYLTDADGSGMRKVNPEGTAAFFPFWFPDSKTIAYSRFPKDKGAPPKSEIVRVKLDGADPQEITAAGGMSFGGAGSVSPDGKRVLYVSLDLNSKSGTVCIRDLESKSDSFLSDLKVENVEGPASFPTPAWSPDGKELVVALKTDKGLGVFRVSEDGTKKTRLTPEGVDCFGGSWLAVK